MGAITVESQLPPKKILVVEDSPSQLILITGPLAEDGFTVETAVDGEEAVQQVFSVTPNCIVLDVVLPKINGFKLCRMLKQDARTSHIPVVLLTCKNTELDRTWGLRQGANAFMTKPFDPAELRWQVRRLLAM